MTSPPNPAETELAPTSAGSPGSRAVGRQLTASLAWDAASTADTTPWLAWALGVSIVVHALAYNSLEEQPLRQSRAVVESTVSFEVAPPPPPASPVPVPEVPPESPPVERVPTLPAPRAAAAPRAPAPQAASPATASTPRTVDLTGLTLTGQDGDFDVPQGNGASRTGPLGPISASGRAQSGSVPSIEERTPSPSAGPRLVAVGDLASRPSAPALDAALRSNYPAEARRRGVAGTASVKARIDPDGIVRQVSTVNETFPGFAEACRKTVKGSHWGAPRDTQGQKVATEVRYTCRFVIVD